VTEAPPATPATTAAPAPDCGNPVASFPPLNPMPDPGDMPAGTYMDVIQQRGRLIAGVSADTLLFGYFNPLSGKLEGFDIDLVNEVAEAIFGSAAGRVEYKVLTYAQRIPALTSGSVDIVADVMTVNCERWAQISFSSQYFDAGQKILVRNDSPVQGIAELDGKRMCAARGSTNIDELENYPKIVVVPVDDISDCMVHFQQGTVDSVTGDDTVLAGFVAQDPYAKVVGGALTSEPYGLGVAKEHPEFVRFVNGVLEDVRDSGRWAQMYRTWLGGDPPPPPVAVYGRAP
jgi:polar amino acid transport system substrate-binding protein